MLQKFVKKIMNGKRLVIMSFETIIKFLQKTFVECKVWFKFAPELSVLAYGVIGNTPVFGTDIQGSSPCRPTKPQSF